MTLQVPVQEKQRLFADLLLRIGEIVFSSLLPREKLDFVCQLLRQSVAYYNWVGFYIVDLKAERELVLGPFAGEPTDHIRIKFGEGICGQAAETLKNYVIQDVSAEGNYLSCSIHVKSEIVLPVFHEGKLIAEVDIDSHVISPFSAEDERFLEQVAIRSAPLLAQIQQ